MGVVDHHNCLGLEEGLHTFPVEGEERRSRPREVEGLRSFHGEVEVGPGFPGAAEQGLRNFPEGEEALFEDEIVRRMTIPRVEQNAEAFLLSQSWVSESEAAVVRVQDVRNREAVARNFQAHQVEAERPSVIVSERRELS